MYNQLLLPDNSSTGTRLQNYCNALSYKPKFPKKSRHLTPTIEGVIMTRKRRTIFIVGAQISHLEATS